MKQTSAGEKQPVYAILDEIQDGYYEVDLRGRYTFLNKAVCEFHGGELHDLIGQKYRKFTSSRSAKIAAQIYYTVYCSGDPQRIYDYEFVHGNGGISYIDLSCHLIRDEQGNPIGFRGIARDRSEEKLNESVLDRYRNFVESIEDGCFEVDLGGTVTFINEAMCNIHGYMHKELLGMNHRGFASPEDANKIFHTFNKIYRTGIPAKIFDYTIVHKDGSLRYLEVSASLIRDDKGNPVGFRGITRDRTEKRNKELELERYKKFVENVEDACFEVDLAGKVTFFNASACKTFGYAPEHFRGTSNREYTSVETAKRIYKIFNKIYQTGQPAKIPDYEIRTPAGEIRYVDMTASLIRDPVGTPIGFRGICRDVTEHIRAVAETERLTELLNQAQRLEAIATLAGGVAHNFNNLLMSIQGYVSLIQMNTDSRHPHFERLDAIGNLIKKGSELTLQLLSYANSSRQAVNPSNMNEIIGKVASDFSRTAKGIHVVRQFAGTPGPVIVDRGQMEHVLMNLFMNAAQAMPDGGTLYLGTDNVTLKESFVLPYGGPPGPYIKLTVTDTGEGMDDAVRERIFEPFFTTKKLGAGAGLGLASVYGIIKSHGGIITVDSKKGKGTTLIIYLPTVAETRVKQMVVPADQRVDSQQKTILLVDDEKIVSDVTRKMICSMGYSVMTAHTGKEAVETFRANQEKIDLIIMDIVMPGMGGDQAIDMIGAIDPGVKVILVSGFIDSTQIKGNPPENQRRVFLQKPLSQETLSKAIRGLLDK